jgi:hypothetical protein
MKVWPIQHWRITLLIRLSWKIAGFLGRKLPGWIYDIPSLLLLVPELIGILLETLQVGHHLRQASLALVSAWLFCSRILAAIVRSPWGSVTRWWQRVRYYWAHDRPRKLALLRHLEQANTYEEWLRIANLLDVAYGTDVW